MRYVSTRGGAAPRGFEDVLLAGLAEDGGLFMPETWPRLSTSDWRALRGLPYSVLAARLIHPFTGGALSLEKLEALTSQAYAGFDHPAVAPLVQLDSRLFALELFHGPTLAFKDMALQLLGLLFDHVLEKRGERITIVGATSGDTGSAAIEACRDRAAIDIVILHPEGRTSEVQRRQMTTVLSPNVANLAVQGSFDDCQDLVKAMFADIPFRTEVRLAAVNSINWVRIAAQIPYYAYAALALGAPDRPVAFSVPTGNFGNVMAAWAARAMGLPIARLIVGSNRNDILTRFLAGNDMSMRPVEPSLSPSMDIQVSSNFERLLFELLGRDAATTAEATRRFRSEGRMPVPEAAWQAARGLFDGFALDDAGTLAEIKTLWRRGGYLADPHTAVGVAASWRLPDAGAPIVTLSTASPAKFPETAPAEVPTEASRHRRADALAGLPERMTRIPADADVVKSFIREFARA